ncbi:carbon-nitrogen hydrolase family protein [Georgenia sp. Z1491]|uniref:carbon-nitrogen hydrolase family protein n=1 Tax=Georgenia sp. Z1491 TaxID=3416707 RepID=UPI003CF3CF47
MPVVRIGLAQLDLGALEIESNVERTVSAIDQVAADGGRIVVLPELANSGYVLEHSLLRDHAEHVDAPGPALTAWSERAAHHGITVVAGFAERLGEHLYNSAVVYGPDGRRLAHYRKLHLFAGESQVFAPGDVGLPIVEVDGVRLGVVICYDLRFPEALRILAVRGAQVVAVPTAWVGGFDRDVVLGADIGQVRTARVMANLNSIVLACASQVGQTGPHSFLGSSVVIDAFGNDVVPPAGRDDERVILVDVDLDTVSLARDRGEGMSPLEQRRTDVYGELLGYSDPAASAAHS